MSEERESSIPRPRFRSVRYSVNCSRSDCKAIKTPSTVLRNRNSSLINTQKFNQVIKNRHSDQKQHRTIDSSSKQEDLYMRTFTTFISRDHITSKYDQNKQNRQELKIYLPNFDEKYDNNESLFTFLDTMVKPVRYVDIELAASHKELKRQRNDVEMLKAEFEALKKAMHEKINGIQNDAVNKLNDLKQTFARHEALEHQRRLRTKKELNMLEKSKNLNNSIFQDLKERNLDIQERIFNCHPYELEFVNPKAFSDYL